MRRFAAMTRVAQFLDALPVGRRAGVGAAEAASALDAAIASARASFPELEVADAPYLRLLAEKVAAAPAPLTALGTLHLGELYLVAACLQGSRPAAELLDARFIRPAAKAAARVKADAAFVDEIAQRLRERVLLPGEDGRPRLSQYSGAGALLSWLKVTATRLALNAVAAAPRSNEPEEEALGVAADMTGLETAAARGQQAELVRAALEEAGRALEAQDRVLLRYHYVDGLVHEQIARIFQTHRTTIARRLATAREALLHRTKEALRRRLGETSSELSSALGLAHSRLDLELSSLLKTPIP